MQISLLLMQQIAQLFLILLMGYAVVKTGLLKASDSKVLSVVFVYLVMPCVVLNAFQIKDTPEIRTGLLYSMGIAVGMHVVFLLLNALFRKALKLDAVEQVNIIYSNAAALVIPIVQALLGEEYVVYSCAFVIVQLVLLWTHASACLQGSARLEWRKLFTNVNLIAIAVGALSAARLAARPDHQHTEQCRQYDRPHGNAAGRYGHCGRPPQKGFLHPAQLSAGVSASAGCSAGHRSAALGSSRIPLDSGRQAHPDDGLPFCHYPRLCNGHLHGTAL